MNTFKMNVYGWSGECSIHTIPWEMYFYLHEMEERGEDVKSLFEDFLNEDMSKLPLGIRKSLSRSMDPLGNDFYWYEGDILCGIRPTNNVSIEVNGYDYAPIDFHRGISIREIVPFRQYPLEITRMNEEYKPTEDWIPTIGFCAYEKGYAGGYTIETTDKVFDINKVTVDVIETSYSTLIDGFYYDGVLMDMVDDPEGNGKHVEMNYGLMTKGWVEESSFRGHPNWRAA